ncbi:protein rep [Streptococcus agalactiae]|uniref:protein rep n=1 Tax=Streptococcus agalactiae TaxID=1311 RepID=UPI0002B9B9F6|nr:protein rep [Streptococcus agalactiae]EPW33624.1 hypothetical protein SAG0068_10425 [Streptococcus agalactiae CCUG 44050]EPW36519.1 hypothetical protein SAG0071_06870 [Streptococcus agalactiae CCUG 44104]EPX34872.1 hypothetical protein SAG0089_09365 [Streptococcus agalactiae LMG 15093]
MIKKNKDLSTLAEIVSAENATKADTMKLYELMKNSDVVNATANTLNAVKVCGDVVKYAIAYDNAQNVSHKKLMYTETCQKRWCPRCMKRKSLSDACEIYALANYLYSEKNYRFLFVTLTVPNCSGADLRDTISTLNKGVDRLMKREPYKSVFKAWIVKVEITYNVRRKDYHPHIHILVAVHKSYLKDKDNFITNERLRKDWQEVCEDSSITQVDIKQARGDTKKKRLKSVLELAKYTAKPTHFLREQKVFDTFYSAIRNRQTLRFCGELSALHKLYELDDYGLLSKWSLFGDEDMVEYTHKLLLKWGGKEYNQDVMVLTDAEKELLKGKTEWRTDKEFVIDYIYWLDKKADLEKRIDACTDKKNLKNLKPKLSVCKRTLDVMNMAVRDFREWFAVKEMSDEDFYKAVLIRES